MAKKTSLDLESALRKSQAMAERGNYAGAYGVLERAIAATDRKLLCDWCGGPNRANGEECPYCKNRKANIALSQFAN